MDKTSYEASPEPDAPGMDKRIVLESYKAACLVSDWIGAVTSEYMPPDTLSSHASLERWSFLEYLSRPEVASYGQVEDGERLRQILAGLELSLLLSTDKGESFAVRREWLKLGRWMRESLHFDSAACSLNLSALMGEGPDTQASRILAFLIEHLPELRAGWREGRADALNDYLYILWLEARERYAVPRDGIERGEAANGPDDHRCDKGGRV